MNVMLAFPLYDSYQGGKSFTVKEGTAINRFVDKEQ